MWQMNRVGQRVYADVVMVGQTTGSIYHGAEVEPAAVVAALHPGRGGDDGPRWVVIGSSPAAESARMGNLLMRAASLIDMGIATAGVMVNVTAVGPEKYPWADTFTVTAVFGKDDQPGGLPLWSVWPGWNQLCDAVRRHCLGLLREGTGGADPGTIRLANLYQDATGQPLLGDQADEHEGA